MMLAIRGDARREKSGAASRRKKAAARRCATLRAPSVGPSDADVVGGRLSGPPGGRVGAPAPAIAGPRSALALGPGERLIAPGPAIAPRESFGGKIPAIAATKNGRYLLCHGPSGLREGQGRHSIPFPLLLPLLPFFSSPAVLWIPASDAAAFRREPREPAYAAGQSTPSGVEASATPSPAYRQLASYLALFALPTFLCPAGRY